ncbi:MAG: F0F1 ATP synthase subunit A [Anaerolineae bacterium]|jgi:F-type H+-transporting ATPase subunit a
MEDFFPQVLFSVFGVPVYDTVVSTWVMMALVMGAILLMRRIRPAWLELLIELLGDLVSGLMRRNPRPYLPFLGSLALFIALSNVISVVPFLVNPVNDINTPLALAVAVFFAVHYFGMRSQGTGGYLKDLATPVFVLPLEIISQFSRTLSLTLRLFGNTISTAMIVAVIFSLIPLLVPLPLIGFSMFTGFLQAYIFTALAAVYIDTGLGEPES